MTFHVTACSTCQAHWVVENLRRNNTVTCPACGSTRDTDKHRSLAQADDRDTACELRAKILADRAGEREAYANTGTYAETRDEIDITEPEDQDAFPDALTDTITEHREKYGDLVSLIPVHADAFEDQVDIALTEHRGKYSTRAEEIAGTIGRNEHTPDTPTSAHTGLTGTGHHPADHATIENTERVNTLTPPPADTPDNTGLTATRQHTTGTITVTGSQPVTELWNEITANDAAQQYFLNAIGTVTGRSYNELETLLNTVGITETPLNGHGTRSLLHEHRRRHTQTTAWKILTVLRELGTGHSTTDDIHAAAQLFRFATTTHDDTHTTAPTIAVEITPGEFEALDRQQRTNICELIGILSKAFDIKLVTTRVTEAFIRHHHRDHLPSVSEWANAHRPESRIDDALTDLNADDTETQILRALDDTPGHTLSYHETHATLETSRSRVRQCISTLKDYGLIETYNPDSAKKITLLNAGEEVLTYFNEHDGRQTTLQNSVSGTPNSSRQRRVPRQRPGDHPAGDRTGTDDRTTDSPGSTTAPYRTVYLNRADHAAIAACGSDSSGVTVVDTGVSDVDSRSRFVSMDDRRGEAVVSVHATNPLDYTVSIAVALASPRLVDAALGERTLDRVLDEVPGEVLRRVRQIGYLTDDVLADSESFRDMLVQWGEDIETMTKKLHHGEYDDRAEFVGEIVSESHGLAGSIVHLLDAAGVDLIRDVRVPAGVNSGKLADLGKSIVHSVLVQSRYQSHAAFRQLFEEREEKRASAFSVEVDAADPHGSFIGSMVVRGGSASRLQEVLESKLEGVSPHEDAPEFVVPVNVTSGVSREMVAVTVARVLGPKNLRAPRRIVSVLDGVVESPFAVAAALQQLGAESSVREMDAAELRFVLRQVPSRDVLPGLPRSAGEIVSVLVHADRMLSQTELCDRAGVSAQTVRNHASVLEATGLVSRDGAGWRVQLSFRVERGEMVLPVTDVAREDVEGGVRRVVAAIPGSCEEDVGRGSSVSVVRAEVVVGGVVEQMSVLAGVDEPDDDIERGPGPGDGVGAGAYDGVGGSGGGAEIDLDFSDVSIPGAVTCD